MTSRIDTNVSAAPPVFLVAEGRETPTGKPDPKREAERERRREALDARVARWKAIEKAGGIPAWVTAELNARGLIDARDPASLSDSEKSQYKDARKAEAVERKKLKALGWSAWLATHIGHLGEGVHWDERTDPDKLDLEQREARARANGMPEVRNADELAKALDVPVATLRWMAFQRAVDTGTHYRRWSIPKRDGSARTITAPKRHLKAAQRWVLRNVAEKLPVHAAAHGFLAGRSIVTNAKAHADADVIVRWTSRTSSRP